MVEVINAQTEKQEKKWEDVHKREAELAETSRKLNAEEKTQAERWTRIKADLSASSSSSSRSSPSSPASSARSSLWIIARATQW